jgi:hypothetical protein
LTDLGGGGASRCSGGPGRAARSRVSRSLRDFAAAASFELARACDTRGLLDFPGARRGALRSAVELRSAVALRPAAELCPAASLLGCSAPARVSGPDVTGASIVAGSISSTGSRLGAASGAGALATLRVASTTLDELLGVARER